MDTPRQQFAQLTEDEKRLLSFFRSLTQYQQCELLRSAGEQAIHRCIPEKEIYDLMPTAAGTIVEIIRDGIEATGEPQRYLLGCDAFDDEETIPRFAAATQEAADRQGSFFNFDKAFAQKYGLCRGKCNFRT